MPLVNDMMRRRKLNELITSWVEYRDMVSRHAGQGAAAPEQERQFLDLQASIAARLPVLQEFATGMGQGSLNTDVQSQIRGITDLMNHHQNLSGNGSFDDAGRQEFMTRWHSYFLFLNRFKGLQNRPQHRNIRDVYAPIASPGPTWGGRRLVAGIFDNWFTRFVIRTVVVVAVVVIAARLIHFDFANAGASVKRIYNEWWGPQGTTAAVTPGVTGKAGARNGGTAGAAGTGAAGNTGATKTGTGVKGAAGAGGAAAVNASEKGKRSGNTIIIGPGSENRGKYHVDGSNEFIPPQTGNPMQKAVAVIRTVTPRPLREFMRPVTQQWGVEATVAMVGVGLLLLAYMLFGRAR